jgi:hypothetical protein
MNFIFHDKNSHFKIIFFIYSALRNIFLEYEFIQSILFVFLLSFIDLNKFSKLNRVNISICVIEYIDLHSPLNFLNFFLVVINIFFVYLHK